MCAVSLSSISWSINGNCIVALENEFVKSRMESLVAGGENGEGKLDLGCRPAFVLVPNRMLHAWSFTDCVPESTM